MGDGERFFFWHESKGTSLMAPLEGVRESQHTEETGAFSEEYDRLRRQVTAEPEPEPEQQLEPEQQPEQQPEPAAAMPEGMPPTPLSARTTVPGRYAESNKSTFECERERLLAGARANRVALGPPSPSPSPSPGPTRGSSSSPTALHGCSRGGAHATGRDGCDFVREHAPRPNDAQRSQRRTPG